MLDYDLEISEAEQKWFIAILLGGAIYNMFIALSLALPFIIVNNVLERIVG